MRLPPLLLGLLLISGCSEFFEKSVADICEEHPQMCLNLNPDGWCRAEKSNIIKNKYQNFLIPDEDYKYKLLLNYEAYKACISKAAQIEHIKLKEKKTARVKALLATERELIALTRDTRDSDNPNLLFYHWSRFGSESHLEKFLSYRDIGLLETPDLQIALASYYVKFDQEKAITSLYHALELYQEGDEINPDIFKSLTNIFIKLEDYESAYKWGYIAREFDADNLDLPQIETLVIQSNGNVNAIKKTAKYYIKHIQSRDFVAPRVKLNL
ncbi:DUF2989 domain-containing protein [Alteromonas sp. a30]|uniref:DUF2989 domain-containing protein n=1 Tax=Alteromonas sp. a30 TaxID=2730917 RepID=UPI00227FD4FB|nr:DUF2989 domain-containing protein [Alteromonas sp. a30]MCY7294027.1 DUF2989 domain-containing protein [Alteromonas sp. a30]